MGSTTKHLSFYCAIACLGGVIYGWEVGMLNIVFSMKSTYGIRFGLWEYNDKNELVPTSTKSIKESLITPMFTFGCMVGSVFAMTLMDRIGRTKPLAIGSFIYAIGSLIQTFSNAVTVFCIGRFISGIACGVSMVVSPVYIAEVTPKDSRGIMGMLYNLVLQGGIFLASFCDTLSLKFITGEIQWRVAVACQLIPAVLFIMLVWFAPETPRYLLMKNKDEKALSILSKVREKPEDDKEIVEEYSDMRNKLKAELVTGIASWKELYENKSYFYRIIIGSGLQFLHMLVGVNAINYYSSQIYSKYLNIDTAKYGAWLVVLSNFIVVVLTVPGIKYVEKAGRRKLLIWGAIALGVFMLGVFTLCFILSGYSKNMVFGILCVLFIYAYCSVYSCTWGSAVYVWQSEVFPLRARSKANAICTMFQYFGSALVTGTVSIIMKYLEYYTFLIFMGMCTISLFFTIFLVKETKGLSLEDTANLYSFDKKYREKELLNQKIEEKAKVEVTV